MFNMECNERKAFSLLELAIVITISAFMISFLSFGYYKYSKSSNKANNITLLNNLSVAIEKYFATNGHLPCPADPTLQVTHPNFGIERLDSTGTGCAGGYITPEAGKPYPVQNQVRNSSGQYFLFGSIPVRSLGLSDQKAFDVYGNIITFVAHDSLANYQRSSLPMYQNLYGYGNLVLIYGSSDISGMIFGQASLCGVSTNANSYGSSGFIGLFGDTTKPTTSIDAYRNVMTACNAQIMNSASNTLVAGTNNNLSFVLISYGPSGRGAWNAGGFLNPQPTNPMELYNTYSYYVNANGSINSTNYSFTSNNMPLKFYQGQKTPTFSHTVVWKTISDLLYFVKGANSVYCHPTTHPGFLNYQNTPGVLGTYSGANSYYDGSTTAKSLQITQSGNSYTLNGVTKACTTYGTWL